MTKNYQYFTQFDVIKLISTPWDKWNTHSTNSGAYELNKIQILGRSEVEEEVHLEKNKK